MDTRVYVISRRLKIVKFKGNLETSETCSSRTIGYSSRIFKNYLCVFRNTVTRVEMRLEKNWREKDIVHDSKF